MKRKIIAVAFGAVFAIIGLSQSASAATFFDDFNDGNTDGWVSISVYPPGYYGSWRLSEGVLIETGGGDPPLFAVEGYAFSDQVVEAKVLWYDMGGAGITVWHQDAYNYVQIFHRYHSGVTVMEMSNNSKTTYDYPNDKWERIWRTMKVVANSGTGELKVYLDNDYLFTHTVQTGTPRLGLTGFNTANAGGEFDDFRITSNELPPAIDIRPWVKSNTINIKGMKKINVAVLATNDFSPFEQVDKTTLTFGATGDESSLLNCLRKPKDINKDGFPDLICSFSTKLTGLKCGDKEVILKGKLKTTGISFETKQDVLIKPCKQFK